MTAAASQPSLFCLVVTRDDAARLPAWLAAVRPLADGVVALDEGSEDGTVELLRQDPLVRTLLEAERRPPEAPRDRATAFERLLEAAADLQPDWLLWLDADERVAPGDAERLRDFLARDALPGLAYGFSTDADGVAFRLFAHRRGGRAAERPAVDAMVPAAIPRARWIATGLRLEPLTASGMPAGEPVAPVLGHGVDEAPAGLDWDAPVISAVVISRNDEDRIESSVRALVEQDCPDPFEVIVVTSGTDRTAEIVRERFPGVELVELSRPALPGEARNAGLARARGDYVTFPGSHIELPQGSLAARVSAHELGYPLVTGTTLNGTRSWAGWATYFLDHTAVLPGRPSGELWGPPGHCSYVRELLVALGGFPEDMRAGEDTVVNIELTRRGYRAYRAQDVRMIHHSRCRTARRLLRHHFQRGRAMARIELDRAPAGRLLARSSRGFQGFGYVRRRLSATTANVRRWGGRLRLVYAWSFPLVAAGATAAWAGFWFEVLRAMRARGFDLAQFGFAGADRPPPRSPSPAQERAHAGAALAALYPPGQDRRRLRRARQIARRALTRAAVRAHLRRCRDVTIVAITGSAGKTTAKDLLGEMLAAAGPTVRTRHNDNGVLGVPATLLGIRPSDRFAVIELGIKDAPGEMRWMAGLFRPRVAVLTGIGTFHSEVFGSDEAIAREKRALLERLGRGGTAVVNADDPLARAAAAGLACRVRTAGWADGADVRLLDARSAWPHGFDLELAAGGRRLRGRVGIHGRHLAPLVAMAVAAAESAGLPAHAALDAAGGFSPRTGRLSPVPGPRGSMLIVDDWKSRVPSAVAAVRALGDTGGTRRIAVLGEVQVDAHTPATYRPIAEVLVGAAHRVVAVGDAGPPLARLLAGTPLASELRCVPDAEAAAASLAAELGPGDVALLHGAGHHDLEVIQLILDPGADRESIRDWRRRSASRVGRRVAEVLAFTPPGAGAAVLEPRHGESLTYLATTGHAVTPDGRFTPAADAGLVARARELGIAALLVVPLPDAGASRALDQALRGAVAHAAAHGHRGVALAVGGNVGDLGRTTRELAGRLHAEGMWLAALLDASIPAEVGAAIATAAEVVVLDAGGSAAVTERPSWGGHAVLLQVPAAAREKAILAASSVVQQLEFRGLALAMESVPAAAGPLAQRFQVRKRVSSTAKHDGGYARPTGAATPWIA